MFFELLETTNVLDTFFDLFVLISFGYLYFMFRSKSKTTGENVYKYLSLSLAFTFLSNLLSMLTMFIDTEVLSDLVVDRIYLFDNISYYLTKVLSIYFFILAAKSLELSSSSK